MRYVKLVSTMLLVVIFVAASALASNPAARKAAASIRPNADDVRQGGDRAKVSADPVENSREESAQVEKGSSAFVPLSMPTTPVQVSGFAGTIHVGAAQTFTTLTGFMAAVNAGAPLTADVTVLLDDATYSEPGFNVGPVSYGAGGPFTLTVRPNTGQSVTTTVTSSATGGFIFTGSSRIVLEGTALGGVPGGLCGDPAARNWHIKPAAYVASTAGTIVIANGSSFITVADCDVEGALSGVANGSRAILITNASAPPVNSDITIQNCLVHTGREGIVELGVAAGTYPAVATNWDVRIAINGCNINTLAQKGINLNNSLAPTIYCNKVTDIIYPTTFPATTARYGGIFALNDKGARINRNTVDNIKSLKTTDAGTAARVYGIRSQGLPVALHASFDAIVTDVHIQNNSVTRVLGQGAAGGFRDIAIEVAGARQDSVTHNTVYLTGSAGPAFDGSTLLQIIQVGRGAFGTAYAARTMAINNLFANDRDCGGFPQTLIRPFGDGGAVDYRASSNNNVLYSPGVDGEVASGYPNVVAWRTYNAPNDANSVGFNPLMLAAADPHWNTAGPSAASNLGSPGRMPTDIYGTARSATAPDAGAVEEATVAPLYHDAFASSIDNPGPAGIPNGLPFSPFQATVGNSTGNAEAAVTVNITVTGPGAGFSGTSPAGALPAFGTVQLTVPGTWTPTVAGTYTAVAIISMSGDASAANDTTSFSFPVAGIKVVDDITGYCTDFETPAALDGWFGDGSWAVGTPAKTPHNDSNGRPNGGHIVGAHSGSNAYVSGGLDGLTGNAGNTWDNLYSPFFNLTGLTSGYLSLFHFLASEPVFDGSDVEYSVDTAKTWHTLGLANDPDGINWYSSSLYQNASDPLAQFDHAGAGLQGFAGPPTYWTSNGIANFSTSETDKPTGPFGYIYARIKLPAAVIGKNYVRFRYRYFSDASGESDGVAMDDFCIQKNAQAFTGRIAGMKFVDVNGNGVKDVGDNGQAGISLILSYFGVPSETTVTDAGGLYAFNNLKPGTYGVTPIEPAGYGQTTVPISVSSSGGDTATAQNIGDYQGSISGLKWDDLNKNGVKDVGEPGLLGWTMEIHKDSCNGSLLQSTLTGVGGAYSMPVIPGTYYVKEVLQSNWVITSPAVNCSGAIVIAGSSGSPSANIAGVNFGNFQFACIRIEKTVDLNGNGLKDAGDVTGMPAGAIAVFQVKKGAAVIFTDTLGNGNLVSITHCGLDLGSYSVQEIFASPQWIQTAGGTPGFVVTTSDTRDTARYLNFRLTSASGTKFNDLNGNGVKDAGEPGLAGWKVNLSGTVLGGSSSVTDTSGNWSIDSVGGGAHVISEVNQAGWTQTLPTGGTYAFNGVSSTVPGSIQLAKDFGNFLNFCVSGVKYRDRNNSGSRQAGEEGLSGWQINITGTGAASINTDANGNYQLCNVGPGAHVVTETPQLGWITTQPAGGNYTFNGSSGVNVTARDFGNFQGSDSSYRYRTFSSDELEDAAQHKPTKPAKVGKPYVAPNIAALLKDYFKQFGNAGISVGLPGQLNAGGKEKAYVLPKGYTDVLKSLWVKGITHSTDVDSTEINRGFDYDNAGKQMLKRFKALPPNKQRNDCFEELLTLSVNMALSDAGKTPAGLSTLLYDDGISGAALNGMTIAAIKAYGDNVMTNTEFQPLSVYLRLEQVAAKINDAFSCGGADCEGALQPVLFDSASWNTTAKVHILGSYPVTAIAYLKANPSATPTIIQVPRNVVSVPTVYTLYQNYPNPFNPTTTIEFDLPTDAFVTLKIYNIVGQEMGTLLNHEALDYGSQSVDFDASQLPSGVYFYRISAQSLNDDGVATGQVFKQVKKMMLVK